MFRRMLFVLLIVAPVFAAAQETPHSKSYELTRGWWFDGSAFVRRAERLAAPKPWLAGAAALGDTAQLERARRIQRRGLQALARFGVRIGIGSDLFEDATSEVRYLEHLGVFDARTLLVMWSRTTPELVFPGRRIGFLEPGYEASFLRLACDPIVDFACTRQITLRVKQGRLLSDVH